MIDIREAIRSGAIVPNHRLGQCFLANREVAANIIKAAELTPGDHVIEVGPGVCALTEMLCEQAGSVTAVEIDRRLSDTINGVMARYKNFTLLTANILDIAADQLLPPVGDIVLVSNMPYSISTPLMTRLFEEFTFVKKAVLMMQTDVSRKLLAEPSTPDYCMLTVFARLYCSPKRLFIVSPHSFAPQPNVESAVMLLKARRTPLIGNGPDRAMFFRVVRAAFASRRKTLDNSLLLAGLASGRAQAEKATALANIPPGARGESLNAAQYAALAQILASNNP